MWRITTAIAAQAVPVSQTLRLRQLKISDADELLGLHQDDNVTRWLLDDLALDSLRVCADFIHGVRKLYRRHAGLGFWAIERLERRYTRDELAAQGALEIMSQDSIEQLLQPQWTMLGWFNLTPVPEQPGLIELGSRLKRRAWGQSIACPVGQQLIDYAFTVLKLPEVYLHCHPGNLPAKYCAAFLGFDEPKTVRFLDSEALRLSVEPTSFNRVNQTSHSLRRKQAVERARQWGGVQTVFSA